MKFLELKERADYLNLRLINNNVVIILQTAWRTNSDTSARWDFFPKEAMINTLYNRKTCYAMFMWINSNFINYTACCPNPSIHNKNKIYCLYSVRFFNSHKCIYDSHQSFKRMLRFHCWVAFYGNFISSHLSHAYHTFQLPHHSLHIL